MLQIKHDRFGQLSKQLEKELKDAHRKIGAMISSSSAAYDARDEAQNRMSQLRDKTEKDLKQYEADMKELNCTLEHDRQVDEFISIKLQERKFTKEALMAREKQEQKRKRRGPEEELFESYQDAFEKLLSLTGLSTLDAVLEKFATAEERNFAHFTYVNEQNNQLEQLREQTAELSREIKRVQEQESQREAERLSRLREVEARQEEVVNQIKQTELLLKTQTKIWEVFKGEITFLFGKLQCDTAVLQKVLGGSTAAQDENIMTCMGLIEKKITELLAVYSFVKAEEQETPYDTLETVQLILGQKPGAPAPRLSIRPPTSGSGHESITEEDQRPMTHTELKEKVLKDVLSKAETPSQKGTLQPDGAGIQDWINTYKKLPRASLT